ncbi:prepilin-type N-terminal cleavage/methylation domain-containing protein [Ningiella sp. W23]|uniref:prepilin-type N-terminal cleavage/methylation domain-containing protein n=1 Tax=Ningiella sp. W23 TaxID=3023715 RepID=UPI003757B590
MQKGFSLLEAIVALLLVTMISMVAFSWISSLLISVGKIEENAYSNQVQRNVTEFLADINVMAQPEGTQQFGRVSISWNAELIEPIRRGQSLAIGPTPYELGLYRVFVNIENDDLELLSFEQTQVGYRALQNEPF